MAVVLWLTPTLLESTVSTQADAQSVIESEVRSVVCLSVCPSIRTIVYVESVIVFRVGMCGDGQ